MALILRLLWGQGQFSLAFVFPNSKGVLLLLPSMFVADIAKLGWFHLVRGTEIGAATFLAALDCPRDLHWTAMGLSLAVGCLSCRYADGTVLHGDDFPCIDSMWRDRLLMIWEKARPTTTGLFYLVDTVPLLFSLDNHPPLVPRVWISFPSAPSLISAVVMIETSFSALRIVPEHLANADRLYLPSSYHPSSPLSPRLWRWRFRFRHCARCRYERRPNSEISNSRDALAAESSLSTGCRGTWV